MGMSGPFSEDVMTIIMGVDPCEPGMHGKLEEPGPSDDAVGLVTKIRDMCEEWLCSAGKSEGMKDKGGDENDAIRGTDERGDVEEEEAATGKE